MIVYYTSVAIPLNVWIKSFSISPFARLLNADIPFIPLSVDLAVEIITISAVFVTKKSTRRS